MDANIQRGYVWQERDLHGPDDVVYATYSIDSDEDSSGDEGKGKEGFVVHKAAKKLAKQEKAARAAAAGMGFSRVRLEPPACFISGAIP